MAMNSNYFLVLYNDTMTLFRASSAASKAALELFFFRKRRLVHVLGYTKCLFYKRIPKDLLVVASYTSKVD